MGPDFGDGVTVRALDVDGTEMVIAEAGGGGQPLLLVHGWTGSKEDFADWVHRLAGLGFHVVVPDQRGHGASAKPADESDYSLALFATDLLALADALDWKRFTLLGHSMGGMVAQVVALQAPERLEALVLMDTHHGPIEVDPEVVHLGVAAARTMGTGAIADMMASATEPGPLDTEAYQRVCAERPGHFEWGIEKTRNSSAAMFAAMLAEMATTEDRLAKLASLGMPTLVLVGDQDTPFMDASVAMAETISSAELVVLADGGHSPQFESPVAWWAAMETFLTRLVVRPSAQGASPGA
jgi:pimeloyl-ACP methyl ester carboxylesterase